jgi:hypothetical protein
VEQSSEQACTGNGVCVWKEADPDGREQGPESIGHALDGGALQVEAQHTAVHKVASGPERDPCIVEGVIKG